MIRRAALLVTALVTAPLFAAEFSEKAAERFANLALACVHKEYPNKIGHSLNSDRDVAPPRQLTPAFYGCYDWHSSVHGHWLLARLSRTFPNAPFAKAAHEALEQSITPEHIAQEAAYLRADVEVLALNAHAQGSASGHRREEGDLACSGEARRGLDVGAVDGGADHVGAREGLGVLGPQALQPGHQLRHRADAGRHVDDLLGLAGLLAHPGEVEYLHGHGAGPYCSMAVRMAALR